MNHNNSRAAETVCAILGFGLYGFLMVVALYFLAGFIPPHSPSLSAEQVAEIYRGNANGIRAGMLLFMIGSGLFGVQMALIYNYMRRIEVANALSPMLSSIQMLCGAVTTAVAFMLPAMFFSIAAFRPERAPELTQLMNDIGWFFLVFPFGAFMTQSIAIGFCILSDRSALPLLPRWLGFLSIFDGFTGFAGATLPFFKTGPFAWSGFFPFWLVLGMFGAWTLAMLVCLLKAINRDLPFPSSSAQWTPDPRKV